ncbi:nitrite reductase large subunit NirB [Demequina capsici]|uniref:assimilatory sulfite reductase (ferredoxin) n=1 Tax=Demequina capsici TaxID=3075620 RepID=A0AA96FDU3_9MICO|nr:nitrite reductase large subunit NirB [Demequina sp. PMTSA13]WNM28323.1 nitrite reductase large subunit NirB [Demequina sp. PMTSA13]
MSQHIVVIGAGMVAHRFVEALMDRDVDSAFHVTVVGEEPYLPYDRIGLSRLFTGEEPASLTLGESLLWARGAVRLRRGARATRIDRAVREVHLDDGSTLPYDQLVIATGSYAWMPPIHGSTLDGVFLYRTIDDVARIQSWAHKVTGSGRSPRGVALGGGLLGLEAAGALSSMGIATTVVQAADRLMNVQVDEGGGHALTRLIERLGVDVRLNAFSDSFVGDDSGAVAGLRFTDGDEIPADIVVVSAGVRPRDELARDAGLEIGERGGVVVDDSCRTADPHVWAIGEVACIQGACWGLVAPGNTMAEVAVDALLGGASSFPGADVSTKLKLLGVDVASFGDAFARTPGALELVYSDPVAGVYKKLVMTDDARTLLGGILVGDASAYASLRPMVGAELPGDPAVWLLPEGGGERPQLELPDSAAVCSCNNVSAGTIRSAVTDHDCHDLSAVKACTRAGTSCGSCIPLVKKVMGEEMAKQGLVASTAMCEHFAMSRAELFQAVQVAELDSFTAIVERFGTGRGCDICKPTVASILASLYNRHVLAEGRAALQDTNDRVMANMQKDGTYSVVPRVPGGEITPDRLIVIGEVAKEFQLYTKITGGQRIDMFGARLEQLPAIWSRLVAAGFESGHAYGKSLRTVKSCVGSTWCRYGVQDSVGMAIALELRYRGLRSPHKIKLGVSGCARECAEARGKDVGVIATEKGWNVYVGGNGGFTPRHAELLAEDLDDDGLLRVIDRYLMLYIRTADRLQRTAPWQEDFEGGLDRLKEIILDDALGICAELDAHMARHIDSYEDEWAAVLRDPERLRQFASFVNAPETPDPSLAYVETRGQRRPATTEERSSGPVLIASTTLEVRS